METLTPEVKTKVDALIAEAKAEVKRHKADDGYWGTERDIEVSNRILTEVSNILKVDIESSDKWCIKATTEELYTQAIRELEEYKRTGKTYRIVVQPTNGCITVTNINTTKEAFNLIQEVLNAHPQIDCDWISGTEIIEKR